MKTVKISLWLPLVVLLSVVLLLFTAYIEPTRLNNETYTIPYDPFGLGFENNCYACHRGELEDAAYYCHELLPKRSYISREYLKAHFIWIVVTLNVPSAIFLPPDITPTQTEVEVNIFNRAFIPATIHVPMGTTVTWVNLDTEVHNVTGAPILGTDIRPFASGDLNPGASFSHTFNEPGSFIYYREFYSPIEIPPEIVLYGAVYPSMLGMVIVTGAGDQEIVDQEIITEFPDYLAPWPEDE